MHLMEKRKERVGRARTVLAVMLAFFITVTALPVCGLTQAEEETGEHPRVVMALTGILEKLDTQLEVLQRVGLPPLEEQLEGIIALLEGLLGELGTPPGTDEERPPVREQIIKLDLMLHRLVFMLERLVKRTESAPQPSEAQKKTRETIAELRRWVDGYIAGATAQMGRIEAREFERMAQAMLGEIGKQLSRMAQQATKDEPEKPRLEIIIERIEALLAKLDLFIIRSFGKPPVEKPLLQAP